jgi:hypothetical protein
MNVLNNFETQNQTPLQPRSRLRASKASTDSNPNPLSLPLYQHPKWMIFIQRVGHLILSRCPDLRQPFLELLDQPDLL